MAVTASTPTGPAFVVGGDALGTPEDRWLAWPGWDALPELGDAALDDQRIVVVAPHPDDEVLGVGGLLRLAAARGSTVEIAAVTDGEACRLDWDALDVAERRTVRRAEVRAALACLGLDARITHHELPDGAVAAREPALAERLTEALRGATWCLAPWALDGHPDHEAAGRAARAAGARAGVPVAEYPVWAWHWAEPGDDRLPWSRARRVLLPPAVRAAKAAAIAEFRSQLEPAGSPHDDAVLPAAVVARFRRSFEVVFT